jgi:hypothetical protein
MHLLLLDGHYSQSAESVVVRTRVCPAVAMESERTMVIATVSPNKISEIWSIG